MRVTVKLFASAREKAQANAIEVTVSEEATLQDLLTAMGETCPPLKSLPGRWAVNLNLAVSNQRIHPDDEIAWIPPVSGG